MPILSAAEIRTRIYKGQLVLDPQRNTAGVPVVEAASYDLRAGIVLWNDKVSKEIKVVHFDPGAGRVSTVTLQPGQMVFVITQEELSLPDDICGTVYSRNKLQKENILALNAGHVDPGFTGPIIIRLINLGKTQWPLTLGEAVFTTVFHTIENPGIVKNDVRTKHDTLLIAQKTAVQAFSNPLHDLFTEELETHFARYEHALTMKLEGEFFRRKEIHLLAFEAGLAMVGLLVLVTKVPWSEIWQWFSSRVPK